MAHIPAGVPKISDKLASILDEHYLMELEESKFDDSAREKIDLARHSVIDFVEYTFPGYKTELFHRHVASELDRVVNETLEGKSSRVMLFAPPQHGKSELVSTRFPPYWLARVPDMPVGMISYAGKLARRNSRAARDVLTSPQYRDVFPHMMRNPNNWRLDEWHVLNHKGYVLPAGVDGTMTGYGFGLAIVDDPIENWAAAQSDTIRESLWQWWHGTLKTRLWEHGSIVFMMTRWHEADLAGRLLETEGTIEEGGRWRVLSYAALAEKENPELDIKPDPLGREPGEPLAPSRYSKSYLEQLREDEPRIFIAEYQQRPTEPEGQMFKTSRVNITSILPDDMVKLSENTEGQDERGSYTYYQEIEQILPGRHITYVRYWDMAATAEDMFGKDPAYTVGTLMARYDTGRKYLNKEPIYQLYVLDVVRRRLAPEGVADMVTSTAVADGEFVNIVIEQEPGSAGKTVIVSYQNMLAGYHVSADLPSGKKEVRANAVTTQFNNGNILVFKASWNRVWLNELASFPLGKFKDQADSFAGAYNWLLANKKRWRGSKFKKLG
jgi:predicted phage terminase large subunit-like protein